MWSFRYRRAGLVQGKAERLCWQRLNSTTPLTSLKSINLKSRPLKSYPFRADPASKKYLTKNAFNAIACTRSEQCIFPGNYHFPKKQSIHPCYYQNDHRTMACLKPALLRRRHQSSRSTSLSGIFPSENYHCHSYKSRYLYFGVLICL